jgi:hypothetical protein
MKSHRTTARGIAAALVALLVCLLTLASAVPAGADDAKPGKGKKDAATVGIRTANAKGGDDRGVYNYEILPRGVVRDWVAISNYRYQPITVRLFAKDATSAPGAPFQVQKSAEVPHDVGAWTVLKKNKITIPPRTEIVVPFQVGVPYNATPGDHSGAIVVSLLAREPKPTGGTIIVDHRVGMRIHLRVPGDLKTGLAIEKLKTSWNGGGAVLGRGEAKVSYLVRNTGNVALNVTNDIELTRILGLPAVHVSAPAVKELLPGGTALVQGTGKSVFGTGPMKARVTLHGVPVDTALKDKKVDVTKTLGFSAWPWLLILIAVGLILLFGTGGWFERRRRKQRKARLEAERAEQAAVQASAKHRMVVRIVGSAAALGLGLIGIVGLTGTPATAAQGDTWQATISKKAGATIEAFDILTSGGCPKPATNVVGFAYGAGFPKAGAIVVSNIDGPVSDESGMDIALVDNMPNIMATQPAPTALHGVYKFVIRCIKAEWPDRSYGEYVASIKFTDPGHWKAMPPLTTKKGPVVQIPTTGPNGEPKSSGGSKAGSGGGQAQGSQTQPSTESPAEVQKRVNEILGKDTPGSGPNWPLLIGGIAIAAVSLLVAFGRRIPGPWRRS